MMDSVRSKEYDDKETKLDRYIALLRPAWWQILLLSFAGGVAALLFTMTIPNLYESMGTISPVMEEDKPNIMLGGLAASFGLSVGGPTRIEDLEALFASRELTLRVFRKYDVWPALSPDRFDPGTGKLKLGWRERVFAGKEEAETPGDWDAVRAAKGMLDVSANRKLGTLSVAVESRSAKGSKDIVGHYLEEAKTVLQERALERANWNKRFLETQLGRTADPIIQERLYSLYSKEVEREMLARNREQFGFTVVDPPLVPDRKSRPRRGRIAAGVVIVSIPTWCIVFAWMMERKRTRSPEPSGA